jgi:hypothetical protein
LLTSGLEAGRRRRVHPCMILPLSSRTMRNNGIARALVPHQPQSRLDRQMNAARVIVGSMRPIAPILKLPSSNRRTCNAKDNATEEIVFRRRLLPV